MDFSYADRLVMARGKLVLQESEWLPFSISMKSRSQRDEKKQLLSPAMLFLEDPDPDWPDNY